MGGFFETYYLLVINEFGCNSKDTTFIIWDFGSCSENSPENDHVIFPNPSSGLLNIEIKDLPVSFTIEIYDSQGTIAYKQDFKNLTTKMLYIDCSNLAKGNYFINISGDNYSSISQIVFY
ncbi:MAG: T9SS type A sorting domain-containing protein [Bacteroidales bacterium]